MKRRGLMLKAVMWAACLSVVAALLAFVTHFHRSLFNSDEAVVNMLAQSMAEQNKLLPTGWISYNGDLMMPSGALIVAPLLAWMPNGFAAHSIAGVFSVFALLASVAAFLRVAGVPVTVALLAVTFCATGFSQYATIYTFAQTTYMWWPMGFFLGATMMVVYRRRGGGSLGHPLVLPSLTGLLVFCISFANPGRVLLMMVLPLYAFDWRMRYEERVSDSPPLKRWTMRLGVHDRMVIFLLAGFALAATAYFFLRYARLTETTYGAANLYWGGWPSTLRHAHTFANGWFSYFGGTREAFFPRPLADLISIFRYLVVAVLTLVGVRALVAIRSDSEPLSAALTAAFATAFFPILAIYILFEPLAFQNQEPTVRYFTVPMFILIALAAHSFRDVVVEWPRAGSTTLVVASLLFCAVAANRFLPLGNLGTGHFWDAGTSRATRLGQFLESNDLKWGYAPWWTAGATMVMSNSRVHVYPVDISMSGVRQNSFMVLRDWYSPERWTSDTFLAIEKSGEDESKLDLIEAQLGPPARSIESPEYRVFVYDHNISNDFVCENQVRLDAPIDFNAPSARLVGVELKDLRGRARGKFVKVRLRNDGALSVSGFGKHPLSIGARLLDGRGNMVKPDWSHTLLRCPVGPFTEADFSFALPDLAPGQWTVRVDLVQEGVAWFQDRGRAVVDLSVDIPAPGAEQ